MAKYEVKLVGKIDEQQTSKQINETLQKVEKQVEDIEIKVNLDSLKQENKYISTEFTKLANQRKKLEADVATTTLDNNKKINESIKGVLDKKEAQLNLIAEQVTKYGHMTDEAIKAQKAVHDLNNEISKLNTEKGANNKVASYNQGNTTAVNKSLNWSSNQEVKVVNELITLENKLANSRKIARSEEAQTLKTTLLQQRENIRLYQEEIKVNGTKTKKAKEYKEAIENTDRALRTQKTSLKILESESSNIWDRLREKAKDYFNYAIAAMTLQQAGQAIRQMINEVVELDGALVELRKVTDLEGDSLDSFVKKAYDTSQTVAKTGREMIEAATEFAKSGYDPDAALQLGQIALMYGNIADEEVSAGESANFIIAQMKAFNIEAKDAMHIIDAVNEVSNNFAVSSADIANNLGKASAVMANAGNSMEEYIAMMTAITEVTRSADKAANGLKTLTLRLQGMNDEGERDLEVQAKMEELFNKLGISVYKSNGELKNTYEIMGTLAPIYKELTNAEKAYVTETIAGKYQAQNAAALLNNWSQAVAANETAINSQGSALNENAKYLDSVEGKLNALSSAFQELSQNVVSSDLIKSVIDLGTGILNFLNSDFGKFIAQWGAMTVAINLAKSAYKSHTVAVSQDTIALISNGVQMNKIDDATKKMILNLLKEKGAYDKKTKSISADTMAQIKNTLATSGLTKKQQQAVLAELTGIPVKGASTAATIAQTIAQEALNAAMTMGISLLVTGLVSGLNALIHASENATKAQEELENQLYDTAVSSSDEYLEQSAALDEQIDKFKSIHKELIDNNTGYTRQLELTNELVTVQEEIKKLTGEQGNNIDLVNGNYEEQLRILSEIKKEKAKDYMAENATAIKNAQNNLKKNYNSGKSKEFASEERYWNEWSWDESTENWWNRLSALRQAMANNSGKDSLDFSYGWGGKDSNHHGFDKYSYAELNTEMNAKEMLDMWKATYEDLKDNKAKWVAEYGLSDEDYDLIVKISNENYSKVKEYIKKQEDLLNKAAEALVYSDDEHTKKITQLQAATAKYNIAEANKDEKGMEEAIKQIADVQSYVNNISDPTVKNYFQNLLDGWQQQIEQSQVDKALTDHFVNGWGKEFKDVLKNMQMDGDRFKLLFQKYLNGDASDLDSNVINTFSALKVIMDEGGYSIDNFTKYLENLGFIFPSVNTQVENANNVLGTYKNEVKGITEELDEIQGAYNTLTSAIKEYNENGYWSIDTLSSIINLGDEYLKYLFDENGQMKLNEQAIRDITTARLQELAAKQYNKAIAFIDSLIAEGNQLKNLEDDISTNTDLLNKNSAAKLLNAYASKKVTEGAEFTEEEWAAINQEIASTNAIINGIIGSINKVGSVLKSGTKSSSSKSTKEWWETELQNLKDQFNYNEITIEEYINGLDKLLSKTQKGSEAWRKINEELQKQRLSKVEDDYKAGRISLEQYIAKLKELLKAYKEGTEVWNNLAEKIKKGLQDQAKETKSDYDDAKSAIDKVIDDEIEKLQDQIDLLKEKNDETERAIELARLQEALENARNNKTKRVWNGSEWVWQADQAAIDDAQKALDDFLLQDKTDEIQKQIDDLTELKNQYADVTKIYDQEQQKQKLIAMLGANAEADILNQRIDTLNKFKDKYLDIQNQIANYDKATPESLVGGNSPSTDISGGSSNSAGSSSGISLSQAEIDRLAKEVIRGKYGNGAARKNALGANYSAVQTRVNQMLSGRSYASGGIVDYTGLAMLHGSPSKPEVVMNYDQIKNLMATITRPSVKSNMSGVGQSIIYNFSGDFNLPNVDNAQKFLRDLKAQVNIKKHSL